MPDKAPLLASPSLAAAQQRYGATAIALHWLTALLLVWGFSVGISMVDLPMSPEKFKYYVWHKWIGITIFLITCARLAWRWAHRAPPMPPMPAWQMRAAQVAHVALYVLLVVIPLSGWIYSSSTGVKVIYLDLVPLPDLVAKDRDLARILLQVHVTLNFTLLAMVCLHAAAALKHHYLDRDTVLARMLPLTRRKG
ncbi:MAG: cytochrome b [Betaproteobacteria bacterium]